VVLKEWGSEIVNMSPRRKESDIPQVPGQEEVFVRVNHLLASSHRDSREIYPCIQIEHSERDLPS